jgi:hypothetical protein
MTRAADRLWRKLVRNNPASWFTFTGFLVTGNQNYPYFRLAWVGKQNRERIDAMARF